MRRVLTGAGQNFEVFGHGGSFLGRAGTDRIKKIRKREGQIFFFAASGQRAQRPGGFADVYLKEAQRAGCRAGGFERAVFSEP